MTGLDFGGFGARIHARQLFKPFIDRHADAGELADRISWNAEHDDRPARPAPGCDRFEVLRARQRPTAQFENDRGETRVRLPIRRELVEGPHREHESIAETRPLGLRVEVNPCGRQCRPIHAGQHIRTGEHDVLKNAPTAMARVRTASTDAPFVRPDLHLHPVRVLTVAARTEQHLELRLLARCQQDSTCVGIFRPPTGLDRHVDDDGVLVLILQSHAHGEEPARELVRPAVDRLDVDTRDVLVVDRGCR